MWGGYKAALQVCRSGLVPLLKSCPYFPPLSHRRQAGGRGEGMGGVRGITAIPKILLEDARAKPLYCEWNRSFGLHDG